MGERAGAPRDDALVGSGLLGVRVARANRARPEGRVSHLLAAGRGAVAPVAPVPSGAAVRAAGAVWGWPWWLRFAAVVAACGCDAEDAGIVAFVAFAIVGLVAITLPWGGFDDGRRGP